jgi:hypothetical protein
LFLLQMTFVKYGTCPYNISAISNPGIKRFWGQMFSYGFYLNKKVLTNSVFLLLESLS